MNDKENPNLYAIIFLLIVALLIVIISSCSKPKTDTPTNNTGGPQTTQKVIKYKFTSTDLNNYITYFKDGLSTIHMPQTQWELTFNQTPPANLHISSTCGPNDFQRVMIYVDGIEVANGYGYGAAAADYQLK